LNSLVGEKYLKHSLKSWQFIKEHMVDKEGGEWYWGGEGRLFAHAREDKVGIWKCPYHNSRACIEIINRSTQILNSGL